MEKILVTKDEKKLFQLLKKASSQHGRIVLQQENGEEYVIVSKREAGLLDSLMSMFAEVLEDQQDLKDAEIAMRQIEEEGGIPFEEVKNRLGIKDEDL